MPVDVAVHEPRAGIISSETINNEMRSKGSMSDCSPNDGLLTGVADAHDITLRRVDEVGSSLTGALNDGEGMLQTHECGRSTQRKRNATYTMKMDRVRSTSGTTRQSDLNDFVGGELIYAACWKKACRGSGSAEDLVQDRDSWRLVGSAIDGESLAVLRDSVSECIAQAGK